MRAETVLKVENLCKSYGGESVLKGVTLSLAAGELVSIMGPSGCGKSTLLHILGLLLGSDSGTYHVLGQDMFRLDHKEKARFRRQFFGFILQSCNVFAHTTVAENVEYPLVYDGVAPHERPPRVREALEQVGLLKKEHERSNRLSGGEQQRVAIARALVNRPKVVFADEPTGQLDHSNTRQVMRHFRDIAESMQLGMIIVTHDADVADYCDVVHTLQDGVLRSWTRAVCR